MTKTSYQYDIEYIFNRTGPINRLKNFNRRRHEELLQVIKSEELITKDLTQKQIDNLCDYMRNMPKQLVLKLLSLIAINNHNNLVKIHKKKGMASFILVAINIDKYIELHRNNKKQVHNEDGPAVITDNGTKLWLINDKFHREDGPAAEFSSGETQYWLNDVLYPTKQDWEQAKKGK